MLTYAIYCIYGCASASLPLSEALSSAQDMLQQCGVILLTGSYSLLAMCMQLLLMVMHQKQDQTLRKHKVTLATKEKQMQMRS